ncbi:MAG: HNH endonuclease [Desulfobulbaceae bacterium]|nr:HNH endonuclease [Desulfobulbaceae bacterium]
MSAEYKDLPPHLQKLIDLLPLNQWVHRSVLENEYGKSNVMRRLRKIRAEYGWDIRTERRNNGPNDDWYMRCSAGPVTRQHIRKEVSKKDRLKVYERDNWFCLMCGADVSEQQQITIAQCDHKVPAERGGPTKMENLQTLCVQCNLKKRQACKYCMLPTCNNCPYAFPEQFTQAMALKLSPEAAQKLVKLSRTQGVPPITLIERLIIQSAVTDDE